MKKLLMLSCLLTPLYTFAGDITSGIERFGLVTEQYANVKISSSINDAPECANSDQYFSFDKTTDHGKQMYSMLLAAFMANKSVYFNYSNTNCGLYGTQTLLTRIDIIK